MRKDFKAHDFKKGEMVRFTHSYGVSGYDPARRDTLGIVLEQRGMKIHISWVTWPSGLIPVAWVNIYNLVKVEKDAD